MISKPLIFSIITSFCLFSSSSIYATIADYNDDSLPKVWQELKEKLAEDKIKSDKLDVYFSNLPAIPSEKPMGLKIKELYTSAYLEKPEIKKVYDMPSEKYYTPGPWYKDIVTDISAEKCLEFIKLYPEAFKSAERKYGTPKELLAALLYVETRLGAFTGKDNAFMTLASMSVSKDISQIQSYVKELPDVSKERKEWINGKMEARSEWAYKEFRALVKHILANDLDPEKLPGSIYGAIGLCQFMPTNLDMYATDGNRDGIVNLFDPEDAIMSAAKYLQKHGWKRYSSLNYQQAVLKKYNNHIVYANTILGLAEQIQFYEEAQKQIAKK